MRCFNKMILSASLLSLVAIAPVSAFSAEFKVRVLNFKTCVEKSKLGKQEQESFDALKKQMENVLNEKEKTLNEMAEKFEDPDYLDSLSPEAETELKRKFRAISQEASQQQSQYMQTLQQANVKVLDKLDGAIIKASEAVAAKNGYNLVINEDSSYFYDKNLDISEEVISAMDENFEKETKAAQ